MNIGEEIRTRNETYIISNIKDKEKIYNAYIEDEKNCNGETSKFFWGQFIPLFINLFFISLIILFFNFISNSLLLMCSLIIINFYFSLKKYFGLNKFFLLKIISLNLFLNDHAYLKLLDEDYNSKIVDSDIHEEIFKSLNKEDISQITCCGKIKNRNVLRFFKNKIV